MDETAERAAAARAEVEEMLLEHQGSDESFDFLAAADRIQADLKKDPNALGFDPDDPDHWWAVIRELRLRGEAGRCE